MKTISLLALTAALALAGSALAQGHKITVVKQPKAKVIRNKIHKGKYKNSLLHH